MTVLAVADKLFLTDSLIITCTKTMNPIYDNKIRILDDSVYAVSGNNLNYDIVYKHLDWVVNLISKALQYIYHYDGEHKSSDFNAVKACDNLDAIVKNVDWSVVSCNRVLIANKYFVANIDVGYVLNTILRIIHHEPIEGSLECIGFYSDDFIKMISMGYTPIKAMQLLCKHGVFTAGDVNVFDTTKLKYGLSDKEALIIKNTLDGFEGNDHG